MKRAFCVVLAVMAALMSLGAARAQIRTVILSGHNEPTFKVSSAQTDGVALEFRIGRVPFPVDADEVEQLLLRVVPTPQEGQLKRRPQTVDVIAEKDRVGGWSTSGEIEPYTAAVKPEAWAPGSGSVLMLQTESPDTDWDYHGGAAKTIADRPRLIVTYNLPSSPAPAGSGQASFSSTSWTLPAGATLLANPVSYKGASYSIAREGDGAFMYQGGAGPVKRWRLGFGITADSFAFVTAWGRLQIITEDAIGSCDLENLGEPNSVLMELAHPYIENANINVNANETPAMGPDGSLYFKNVKADGCIVAYNPSLQEIWRTELKFRTVSPISLSANGHHAYALAEIPVADPNKDKEFDLVRIDTATGETVTKEVEYEDMRGKHVSPLLTELLQPVVASNENVDYVFVAGNTNDTGIFQLVAFEQSFTVLWSRRGKVASSSVADRFSLFVFGDGSLNRYPFDRSLDSAMEEAVSSVGCAGALLADGANPLYMFDTNDLVKQMNELGQERDETKRRLGEKEQELEQEHQKLDEVTKKLDEKEQELTEVNEQIPRARTRGVVWGLGIAGVTISACLLLRCWILRRRKEKTGRAQGGNIV